MNRLLPMFLAEVTLVLMVLAWIQSGGVESREMQSANAPEQAVRLMFSQIKSHNYDAAYARLANRGDVDRNAFIREFEGSYGSLLTYSSLENFDVSPLPTGDKICRSGCGYISRPQLVRWMMFAISNCKKVATRGKSCGPLITPPNFRH